MEIFNTDSVQSSSNTCKNYLLKIYSQHGNFFIQNITMLRRFFGNLIFAIIARMLCENHLKRFVSKENCRSSLKTKIEGIELNESWLQSVVLWSTVTLFESENGVKPL